MLSASININKTVANRPKAGARVHTGFLISNPFVENHTEFH